MMNPFVNPNKRGVELPAGCKDLVDCLAKSLELTTSVSPDAFIIKVSVPGATSEEIVVKVEGTLLRVAWIKSDKSGHLERTVEVPNGYDVSKAKAECLRGILRIAIPIKPLATKQK